jgi:membrane-associated phospholipid phosphatase
MHRLTSLIQSTHARAVGLMLLALAALAVAVTESASVARFDQEASRTVHESTAQPVTDWTATVTTLGGTEVVVLVTLAAIALLAIRRHWHGILTLTLAVAVTSVTVHATKVLFSRPRPDEALALADAAGFSFPSGHAATSMAAYATLTLIVARTCLGTLRLLLVLGGALVILAVGLSRVYLGVHYTTDVLAGWLTGAVLVTGSWAIVAALRRRAASAGATRGDTAATTA